MSHILVRRMQLWSQWLGSFRVPLLLVVTCRYRTPEPSSSLSTGRLVLAAWSVFPQRAAGRKGHLWKRAPESTRVAPLKHRPAACSHQSRTPRIPSAKDFWCDSCVVTVSALKTTWQDKIPNSDDDTQVCSWDRQPSHNSHASILVRL